MKLLFIVSLIFASYASTGQSTGHLEFKGIPIDGTLSDFVTKLRLEGFTMFDRSDNLVVLTGDFAGYREVLIGVLTTKHLDLVSSVKVIFPEQETWSNLSSNYYRLKEMLSTKYGDPSEVSELFETAIEPSDDMYRMHAVKFDQCKYWSLFETDKGSIQLSIEQEGGIHTFVLLVYFDRVNTERILEEAIDDL
jgi:hypothetical protein